jgi:hypothetical protein
MLLHLVQGALYGEETRVSIPIGGRRVEVHTVLRNPGVYIDPGTAPVAPQAVADWQNLVERCIRFEAKDRFPSMASLADALAPLVEKPTLAGHLEVPLSFGRIVLGNGGAGEIAPCWLTSAGSGPGSWA